MTPKQIAELEERLKVAKAQLKAKEQREAARLRAAASKAERTLENRKKILIGAAMLDRMKKKPESEENMLRILDGFLTRDSEREIFNLPPIRKTTAEQKPLSAPVVSAPAPARG